MLLKLELLFGATLEPYAGAGVVLMMERNAEEAELILTAVMKEVSSSSGLELNKDYFPSKEKRIHNDTIHSRNRDL